MLIVQTRVHCFGTADWFVKEMSRRVNSDMRIAAAATGVKLTCIPTHLLPEHTPRDASHS